jgi:two-component system cell cycle response regulator CtrA
VDVAARLEGLEAENERLQFRVEELERCLGMDDDSCRFPVEWLLTASESRLLGFLMTREMASKEAILLALYSLRADDAPDIKIVDVFVCKARKKLSRFGVQIETIWGQGYRLCRASKDHIRALKEDSV